MLIQRSSTGVVTALTGLQVRRALRSRPLLAVSILLGAGTSASYAYVLWNSDDPVLAALHATGQVLRMFQLLGCLIGALLGAWAIRLYRIPSSVDFLLTRP